MLTLMSSTMDYQYSPRAVGPFGQRDTQRRPRLPQSAQDGAGSRSRLAASLEGDAPLRRQDAVRLQRSPSGQRHCSHAYLDEAHVTKIGQQ